MLEFKKPVIEDKPWVDRCLKHSHSCNCEYTFGDIFVWSTAYRTLITHYKDFFICRWGKEKDYFYSLPIGNGDFSDAVNAILNDAAANGVTARIYGVTDSYKTLLDKYFPDKFTFHYDEGNYDYIYSVQKMASLSGKKYHSKRNHINNFIKNNPDWSFEVIDESNIDECIGLHTQWINNKTDDDGDYSFEFESVLASFENYKALDFKGGLLRVNGKVIAYTMGEALNGDVFVTHFEKAPADMQGAYTLINREFTRNCLMSYKYVNREEDLGIEGLRKAKQSYYPEIFLKKGTAIYNG